MIENVSGRARTYDLPRVKRVYRNHTKENQMITVNKNKGISDNKKYAR